MNTDPNWVLRDLVNEVLCTFDDDDFEDLLYELSQPFLETPDVGASRMKEHLSRDYPVKGAEKSSWQDQNESSASLCLDIVDYSEALADGDEDSLEKELFMKFGEVSNGDIQLMFPTAPVTCKEWQDINDSFHHNLCRDSVAKQLSDETDSSNFEDMVTELSRGFKAIGIGLHSGYLLVKEEGPNSSWEKKYFVIKLNPNDTIRVEYFEKMGGVMQGQIDCSCSEVAPSDEEHGITVVTSCVPSRMWQLKAFSAEQQYQWVQALTDACEKRKKEKIDPVLEVIKGEHETMQL